MEIVPATTSDHLAAVRTLFREYERFLNLDRSQRCDQLGEQSFKPGRNIAMKIPPHEFERTVEHQARNMQIGKKRVARPSRKRPLRLREEKT
jgi:hypothetical protein